MTDLDALFRAVAETPDDDTPRLVYADRMDELAQENPVRVECRRCKGTGSLVSYPYTGWAPASITATTPTRTGPSVTRCPTCSGHGTVLAPHPLADRAEFVRVQCELAGLGHLPGTCQDVCPCMRLARRERELLDAHARDWLGAARCLLCRGQKTVRDTGPYMSRHDRVECPDCRGTGYACWPLVQTRARELDSGATVGEYLIRSRFRRGFVHKIELTAGQFTEEVARTICAHHPLVEEVVLTDAVEELLHGGWGIAYDRIHHTIRSQVIRLIPENDIFPTRESALAALSRACAAWGRSPAEEKEPD